jgi:hypothetical protein
MKKLLTTVAVLTVIAGPAFAYTWDPEGDIGQIDYTGIEAPAPAMFAFASASRQEKSKPVVSLPAYDVEGHVVGADPDANVRLEMRRDDVKDY